MASRKRFQNGRAVSACDVIVVLNIAGFQPRSQGLSSLPPKGAEKRDPGNEWLGFCVGESFVGKVLDLDGKWPRSSSVIRRALFACFSSFVCSIAGMLSSVKSSAQTRECSKGVLKAFFFHI